MILTLEIIGTIAFAVSGAMVAIGKKMDIFGVIMLGVTTAVGGGVIRDVILDTTPPLVFQNPVYALTGAVVSLLVFLPFIRRKINVDGLILQVMDSIGLAIFVVVGIRYSISFENRFLSVFVGVLIPSAYVASSPQADRRGRRRHAGYLCRRPAHDLCPAFLCLRSHPGSASLHFPLGDR